MAYPIKTHLLVCSFNSISKIEKCLFVDFEQIEKLVFPPNTVHCPSKGASADQIRGHDG